ncbi:hypothetical protein [Pseudomonas pergaminensis]
MAHKAGSFILPIKQGYGGQMSTYSTPIKEGVSLEEALGEVSDRGRLFSLTIQNSSSHVIRDIAVGVEYHAPVNGQSGEIYAGYTVGPGDLVERTFSTIGCIRKVQILYWVDNGTKGYHYYFPDAPVGSCAARRQVKFNNSNGFEGEVIAEDIDADLPEA